MRTKPSALLAHTLPFGIFMAGLAAVSGVEWMGKHSDLSSLKDPKYWIYPIQTILCAGTIAAFWKHYDFGDIRKAVHGVLAGAVVFLIWISPQLFLGFPARVHGFNPDVFAQSPFLYWTTVAARFLRLVVVVPLVEEVFWRGFLMRYLIDEDFQKTPFGSYAARSFWPVVLLFGLAHLGADFIPACITAAIYGGLAVRTKSLFACIAAHSVTNALLGAYIMATRQWGFW